MLKNVGKTEDILKGFSSEVISFPNDYEGVVLATLVSKMCPNPSKKAVLYIHGYSDYFFQSELADFYLSQDINFYALDLRKYGRSWMPHQHFNFCKDMHEYYAELDAAVDMIRRRDGNTWLLLNGHSTGGLLAAIYAHDRSSDGFIDALFLNSPFFDFNKDIFTKLFAKVMVTPIGRMSPFFVVGTGALPLYGESVHKDYKRGGTFVFNEDWKPVRKWKPMVCAGWIRAIRLAQIRVQSGLGIQVPTLLMRSDKSGGGPSWNDTFENSDCVLNVEDMQAHGKKLNKGQDLFTQIVIKNGMHDLACSRQEPRKDFYLALQGWIKKHSP